MRNITALGFGSGLFLSAALALPGAAAHAAPFLDTNSVVLLRVGDGTTTLAGTGAAVYLEEYSITYTNLVPTGATHVQTIAVPSTGTTGNKLTIGGTANLEGGLNFSADGQYLMFAGYDALVGGSASGGNNRRLAGRIDLAGNVGIDAIYGPSTNASNNAIRTITSLTGGEYWFGTTNINTGISYRPWMGGNDSSINSTPLNSINTRRLEIYNGQLYVDSAAGSIFGVATVGSGTPTTTGQTVTLLPGMPSTAGPSPIDFFFADDNTLYVADDRTFNQTTSTGTTNGGLQKWIFDGTNWSLAYTKNIDTTNETIDYGLRGLTGSVDANGRVTLFGTSTFGTTGVANFLVGIDDMLGNTDPNNVSVNSLASSASIPGAAGSLTTFRGLEAIGIDTPEPGSLGLAITGLFLLTTRRRTSKTDLHR